MSKIRIISFDGGGIKGILPIVIMQRLKSEFPEIIEKADLLAGTSTGGIIALGLASGMPLESLKNLYIERGEKIFKRRWHGLGGLLGARYTNKYLKRYLVEIFQEQRMGDLGKKVVIPAFDLMSSDNPHRWKPKFFHNFGDDKDNCEFVSDVALRTSAAPTYFKSHQGYIDGGLIANNPSLAALCQSLDERYGSSCELHEISLLSLGTGLKYPYIKGDDYDFSAFKVASLMNIVLGGTESVPDYQCKIFLGDSYHRIDPYDPKGIALDDVKNMGYLTALGESFDINWTLEWLKKNW